MTVRVFLAAAVLLGGLAAALPASATLVSGSVLPLAQSSSPQVVLARDKHQRKVWVYNRHRHGPRFAYRHGRYRYFYNGFYYANPWWTYGPGVTIGVGPGYANPDYGYASGPDDGTYAADDGQDYADQGDGEDDPHVAWCMNRYRTYDPDSDSFTGYDGLQHRCNSPY
jgi:hypothetical protein